MKLAENPAKVGKIISVVVVFTIFVEAVNFFYYFMNSSGDQSTVINSLIMYLGMAIILSAVVVAIVVGRAGKSYRNNLGSGEGQVMRSDSEASRQGSSVVAGGASESIPPESDVIKK